MNIMDVSNAKEAADVIGYRRGTVTAADYAAGTISVLVDGTEVKGIPVVYDDGEGSFGVYAFCAGDDVLVRYSGADAQCVAGFFSDLWPCVPMPSSTLINGTDVFSMGLLQKTDYVRSPQTLFSNRYEEIATASCSVSHELYINQQCPDMSGKFVILETDTSVPARDVNVYYNGAFIYHTYNANPSGVFNGTRSNIIGTFINTHTGTGVMVYQVNTFRDWIPQISGHVDFDFYLYASTGVPVKICSASCDVLDGDSQASGQCVVYADGFRCDDETLGYMMCCRIFVSSASDFSAGQYTNAINGGDRIKNIVFSEYATAAGLKTSISEYGTDSSGRIPYPDGSMGYPSAFYYKKKR